MLLESFFGTREPPMLIVKTDTAQITSNIPFKAYTVRFRLHLYMFWFQFSLKQQSDSSFKILLRACTISTTPTLVIEKTLSPKSRRFYGPSKNIRLANFFGANCPGLVVSNFFREAFSESRLRFCVKKILGSPF